VAVWLLTTRRIMVDVAVSVGLLKVYCFANYIYFTLSSQAQMLRSLTFLVNLPYIATFKGLNLHGLDILKD